MADFTCDNLSFGWDKIRPRSVPFRARVSTRYPGREVTEQDKALVEEWLDKLPQEAYDDPEIPLPTAA